MIPATRSMLAVALLLAGTCRGGAVAKAAVDKARQRMLAAFGYAEFYTAPEFPPGCLEWEGSAKGDSVLFVPKLAGADGCKQIAPIADQWILPAKGGLPRLVDGKGGKGRIEFSQLIGIAAGGPEERILLGLLDKGIAAKAALAEDEVSEGEGTGSGNSIDAILAGGGGAYRKRSPEPSDGEGMSGMGGIGFGSGGRAGWGTGNGGARQGKTALGNGGHGKGRATRAKIDPPKPSDIELAGDAGTRSSESILQVIGRHIGGFRYAYEKYLKEYPNLGGKLTLKFTIAPSGDIVAISIAGSNTGNTDLDDEIKDKARRMKFDQIEKGNVVVTYSFVLDRQ